jgi:O-antigen/teichoic acid export membrane protein
VLRVLVGPLAADAVAPAMILVWSLPFLCVQVTISQALIALGRPSQVTRAFVSGFAVALTMHALLGPRYGAVGAAVASLARDPVVTVVLLTQYYRMRRRFPVAPPEPRPAPEPVRAGD